MALKLLFITGYVTRKYCQAKKEIFMIRILRKNYEYENLLKEIGRANFKIQLANTVQWVFFKF